MHFYSRMWFGELNNLLAIIKHTIEGHVGGVLHERAASEVDQLDFQRVRVHQEVLQFYITMEDATLTANVSGMNDLPHYMSCHLLIKLSSEFHKVKHAHAGHGPLRDHDVVVRVVLPVQEFDYLWYTGALIGQECQANLYGEAFWMTRLKERRYDAWMEVLSQINMVETGNSDWEAIIFRAQATYNSDIWHIWCLVNNFHSHLFNKTRK